MKSKLPPAASVSIIVGVAALAFFVGKFRAAREVTFSNESPTAAVRQTSVSAKADSSEVSETIADRMPKPQYGLTVEQARRLTPEERLARIADAALVFNSGNQVEALSGLIGALSKDEILQATDLLGGAQDRGNFQPQEIWIELWTQWGRVDPLGGLQHFVDRPGGKGRDDARSIMHGWLGIDPDAAILWAHEPKRATLDAAAAALALSHEAGGDLGKMEATMLALPENGMTRAECADRYFDMAALAGDAFDPAATYDAMPEALQPAAWSAAFGRISQGARAETIDWVKSHYEASSQNDNAMVDFIGKCVAEDAVGTVAWTSNLPSPKESNYTPLTSAVIAWMSTDREAALKWVNEQPANMIALDLIRASIVRGNKR
ncbi:MAG: hypothetical protein V4640_08255 [Verrucomicrobiota bacterium]